MSILLDALKKSERQRQLGQTPTLQTLSAEQPQASESFSHWVPLSMLLISVCVMSWFGWQQLRPPVTAILPSEGVADTQPARPEMSPGEESGPRTLTESYRPDDTKPGGVDESQQGSDVANEENRARLSRSVSEFTSAESGPEVAVQTRDPANEAAPATPPPADIEPATRQETSRNQPVKPHVSEPVSFWELPQGVRDTLPEIKITVLVFSDQQEDRFILTNGQRLVEKDELQSGLVLDEIRRDGAVFLYRNYRFLVKG